jgi:AcrR family transcriptional regulator
MTAVIMNGGMKTGRRAMATADHGPRERMVFSAAQLLRRGGVAAAGMRETAAQAHAPRGSLQHYFPGGKEQVVNEAVAWAGRYAASRVPRFIAALDEPSPSALFAAMAQQWTDELVAAGTLAGCPVAAATTDCAQDIESTRTAAAEAFACWRASVTEALTVMDVPPARAEALATLMISTLEGAILIARAERSPCALATVVRELAPVLDAAVVRAAFLAAPRKCHKAETQSPCHRLRFPANRRPRQSSMPSALRTRLHYDA